MRTRSIGQIASSVRHGTVMIYTTIGMVAFAGFVSLGVDAAHVRMVKTQLQAAADAAARYAATGLQTSGVTSAKNNAVSVAGDNTADGSPVVVDPNNDVDFGTWDSTAQTFTVLTGAAQANANAVRVTCRRTAARSNPVSLTFGSIVGKSQFDVTAQSIALAYSQPLAGIIGFGGLTFQNNTFIGSYNSKTNKNPNQGNADSKARIGLNGAMVGHANDSLEGDVVLGPSASVSGVTISGSQLRQTQVLPTPTLPAWAPQTNPGGIPQVYSITSDTTLPAGNYWFTSLTIGADLTFAGPSVVYVNGNVVLNGTIAPASNAPSDLMIYQYGSNTFGDSGSNNISVTADVIAPNSNFAAKNNLNFYGSAIFNSITTWNNANFFYDEALGPMNGGTVVSTVQ